MANVLEYESPPPKEKIWIRTLIGALGGLGVWIYTIVGFFSGDWMFACVLTPISLFMLLLLTVHVYFGYYNTPLKRARKMLTLHTRLWSCEPEWVRIDAHKCVRVNHGFLSKMQKEFESHGMRLIGDVENAALTRVMPSVRFCQRIMVDPAGRSVVAFSAGRLPIFYHILAILLRKKGTYRTGCIQSFLADDMSLVTAFPSTIDHSRPIPWNIGYQIPWEQGISELIRRHEYELATYLAKQPGVEVKSCATWEEIHALYTAGSRRINEYMKQTGYLTPDDLRRTYGPNSATAKQLIPALEQILYEQQTPAAPSPSQTPT